MIADRTLLAVDIGTSHCKAGIFVPDGTALRIATRPMPVRRSPSGEAYFEPGRLWAAVSALVREVDPGPGPPVAAVGIAGMAETGLLVDRRTGAPRSHFVPWFDTAAQPQADRIARRSDALERYLKTGRQVSFKCSLAKLLWLRDKQEDILEGAVWLSAADYVAYRLTGRTGTDPSLAGFTCAFRVDRRDWDAGWLDEWRLPPDMFPPVHPSGTPLGGVLPDVAASLGLVPGTQVAVCGHDHTAAAFAMGVSSPGRVFDSMGTAETLIGAMPERRLSDADFRAGLVYGCHVAHGRGIWLGGLSASGGSVEWLRRQLGSRPLTYRQIETLLAGARPGPTGILFFPYLLGSGPPHADPRARGAFLGLSTSHGRADLLKAVLEGTACEVEVIHRAGEHMSGRPIASLSAAGGGTRSRAWLQIKADVSGCRIEAAGEPEATLLGAALLAGIGSGLYPGEAEALAGLRPRPAEVFLPDGERHAAYRRLYEERYLPLQELLRQHVNQPWFNGCKG